MKAARHRLLVMFGALVALAVGMWLPATPAVAGAPSGLHVSGNHLLDDANHPVRLLGVDRPGTEWPCVQGWGIFDGPTDTAAAQTIASWGVNTVRIPLNEDCWLGINGVPTAYGGANYQNAINGWVDTLHNAGLYVVLDLHWSAPGTTQATGQQQMADVDHSLDFWTSVATRFAADHATLFDLYNEPHDISDACWRDGCTIGNWQAAGMQQLVNTVRATGATNPIIATCNGWGNGCGGWLGNRPSDPQNAIVAGVHIYEDTGCNTQSCWDGTLAPMAAAVPVVTGEFGDKDCNHDWSDGYLNWADAHGVSYLAWAWYPGDCAGMPALITDWNGTPSGFGVGIRDHLS